MTGVQKDYLTPKDVAKALDIGINAAYDLFRRQDFPGFSIYASGRGLRVSREALRGYLEGKRHDLS